MPAVTTSTDRAIATLQADLQARQYAPCTRRRYLAVARSFLHWLGDPVDLSHVRQHHVEEHLGARLRAYRRQHRCSPRSLATWKAPYESAIAQLLRSAGLTWPLPTPESPQRTEAVALASQFGRWLEESRGLRPSSIDTRRSEALRFLDWLLVREQRKLQDLELQHIDCYLRWRCEGLRRISCQSVTNSLRVFMRFLVAAGHMRRELAVLGPKLYRLESIPATLADGEVQRVIEVAKQNTSAKGLRDRAIVMLLATYGLRAGECTRLRLEDVDWRRERLWIRHTKTGSTTCLPLVPAVGEALLAYLREGRPASEAREIFLRSLAPYKALSRGSALYGSVSNCLRAAGIHRDSKRGSHVFRHTLAVMLMREQVCAKAIGDLLGHRSAASTQAYLKVAMSDLRGLALELPAQGDPS